MISSTILFVDELPFLQKFSLHNFEYFMTISITSQQNVCEEKKAIEQFQLFIFGTEVFLAKGTTSHTLVFLISDKKKEPPN